MHGLEQGFNSNDHKRATVIHDRMGSATSGCIQSVDYPEIEKFLIGHQTDRKCVAGGLTFVITEEEEKNPGQNCGRTKVGK